MELVKGKTLAELLPKHGFPLNRFFDIAIPLADAVAAAHQEGITHRDLKPDNAMVTDDGRVKVLDFGLAKPVGGFSGSEGPTAAKTREGVIVGTLNYMSPEQAEGKQVDHRSDIFSLGTLFYEMLTGQKPFQGESATATLSAILKDEPVLVTDRNSSVPVENRQTLSRQGAPRPLSIGRRSSPRSRRDQTGRRFGRSGRFCHHRAAGVRMEVACHRTLLAIVGVAGGLALVDWLSTDAGRELPRLTNPVQITSAIGVEDYPTWSPDGKKIAYTATGSDEEANWDIWVKQIETGQPVNRTADYAGGDCRPSWSPDGNEIAFWSDRDGGGYFVMSAVGGRARKVIAGPLGGAYNAPQWSAGGQELAGVVVDSGMFSSTFSR